MCIRQYRRQLQRGKDKVDSQNQQKAGNKHKRTENSRTLSLSHISLRVGIEGSLVYFTIAGEKRNSEIAGLVGA